MRHQIFLEPEGLNDHTIYPNGISTSLPPDIQQEICSKISGLEHVKIIRPGYAIEYDFVDRELTLATKKLKTFILQVKSMVLLDEKQQLKINASKCRPCF